MISIYIIFTIIITHYIADFIMQDEKWAVGKSKNVYDLTYHVWTYSLIWIVPAYFMLETTSQMYVFLVVTFCAHWITDYITSRIVSKKFEAKHYGSPIPNLGAFSVIGFDQLLHYTQLFLTYYLLKS